MRVVLLPGMNGSGQLHDAFIAAMAPRFQVESVTYPADRFLDDRQLQAFVAERLRCDAPFLLIGESFSGPIAIRIAVSRPSGLAGLVLCATFAASPRPWLGHLRPLLALPLPVPPARMLMPAMMGRWTTQDWTRRAQAALAALPAAVARARLGEVLRVDATADLTHIRVPTLYLQASHDRLVPRRCRHEIHVRMPHARRARLRGSHFLLQHHPAGAARAIRRHFAECADLHR